MDSKAWITLDIHCGKAQSTGLLDLNQGPNRKVAEQWGRGRTDVVKTSAVPQHQH